MADSLETLQARLAEARTALHNLSIGQQIVEVQRDGRRMKFGAAQAGDLRSYITTIEDAIAELDETAASRLPRRRFIPVRF